jgi:hypothetical protein
MIPNLLNTLLGLWLAYRAIFTVPAGDMNNLELTASGIAVVLLALWARQTDYARWHSNANAGLGVVLLALAVARWVTMVAPLAAFWFILLGGIAVAIIAMWAMLYRRPASAATS